MTSIKEWAKRLGRPVEEVNPNVIYIQPPENINEADIVRGAEIARRLNLIGR